MAKIERFNEYIAEGSGDQVVFYESIKPIGKNCNNKGERRKHNKRIPPYLMYKKHAQVSNKK